MGAGIEHRSAQGVLEAFQDYDCPNFTIWNGKRLCYTCDDDNMDIGMQTLINCLNQISQSGTSAIYLIKVYAQDCGKITSSTPYRGSTTFMLSPTALTTTGPGPGGVGSVHIIDNAGKTAQYGTRELNTRLDALEKENRELLERVHKSELNEIRNDFTRQIAGITQQAEDKTWWDRLFDTLEKKPEILDKLGDGLAKVAGIFRDRKDYIVNPAGGSVSGTTKNASTNTENNEDVETDDIKLSPEGALINPFLHDNERTLKASERSKILVDRLTPLTQDQHDDIHNETLQVIEQRIGSVTLSRMLLAVACMDNEDLNKLLNHLD